jgi:hypothetical protein
MFPILTAKPSDFDLRRAAQAGLDLRLRMNPK